MFDGDLSVLEADDAMQQSSSRMVASARRSVPAPAQQALALQPDHTPIQRSGSSPWDRPDFGAEHRHDGGHAALLHSHAGGATVLNAAAKRAFDIAFVLAFLLVALPALILLAVIQQLDSPGSLFFVQPRIGRNGRIFGCIKLRTMCEDAESVLADILATSAEARAEWDADHKLRNDPRISRFGRLLRKLSLDELPQLINILRGEMSVVGPRPIVQAEIVKYGAFFVDYCAVKPGLTGLWQVSGRNDISYDARVRLDRDYRVNASFAFDMKILARTVPAVLGAHGSY